MLIRDKYADFHCESIGATRGIGFDVALNWPRRDRWCSVTSNIARSTLIDGLFRGVSPIPDSLSVGIGIGVDVDDDAGADCRLDKLAMGDRKRDCWI